MQKMIEELKDEISRLKQPPKRPKFRTGGMEPRDRSKKDKPSSSNTCNSIQALNNPKKEKERSASPG